ncbi:MAG: hypothetical protein HXS53_12960 [Theionarchaea archaeon]|nr:hypothetical protein [Theionarchaea archaeon]
MALLIALDIDEFSKVTRQKGWTQYSPNPVTRYLSHAVADLAEAHHATILQGLDYERGTEEAQIYCSSPHLESLIEDLEHIRSTIYSLGGTTLSIGIALVPSQIPVNLLVDFPLVKKALRKSKRKKEIVIL